MTQHRRVGLPDRRGGVGAGTTASSDAVSHLRWAQWKRHAHFSPAVVRSGSLAVLLWTAAPIYVLHL